MLTAERVRHLFTYDEEIGVLVRNFTIGKASAGTYSKFVDHHGYRVVGIDRKLYGEHRVIWLYKTGQWPSGVIDHIDRQRANNRWINLRDVTQGQNKQNQGPSKNCKSGVKGVAWNKKAKKWRATIQTSVKAARKTFHLGSFESIEEAAAAYAAAAAVLHQCNPSAKVG